MQITAMRFASPKLISKWKKFQIILMHDRSCLYYQATGFSNAKPHCNKDLNKSWAWHEQKQR